MGSQKRNDKYNKNKTFTEKLSLCCGYELDENCLERRQKQIDYGKNTEGYKNYLTAIPKEERTQKQPKTPCKYQLCSRRSFDNQIKIWRLVLHAYDDVDQIKKSPDADQENNNLTGFNSDGPNGNDMKVFDDYKKYPSGSSGSSQ